MCMCVHMHTCVFAHVDIQVLEERQVKGQNKTGLKICVSQCLCESYSIEVGSWQKIK